MKKKCIVSFLLSLGLLTNASAAELRYEREINNNTITVHGETDKNVNVAMQVFMPEKDIDEIENGTNPDELLAAVVQTKSDENGRFDLSFRYDGKSGLYKAYLFSPEWENKQQLDILFVSSTDYERFIESLNASDGAEGLYNIIKDQTMMFGESFDFENDSTVMSAATGIYNHIKTVSKLNSGNYPYNSYVYHVLSLVNAISNNGCDNILNYSGVLPDGIDDYWYEYVNTNAAADFNSRVKNAKPKTVAEYEKAVKDSIILSVVKRPNGNTNAYKIINEYAKYIGVSGISETQCRQKISGNDYADIAKLKNAIEDTKGGGSTDQGGTGGSKGTNNSKGTGGSKGTNNNNVIINGTQVNPTKAPIKVKFSDIDDVAWASEAIYALADKEIISGKSEGVFAPDDSITREEFVKMIVLAFGIKSSDVYCGLTDVDKDMWYAEYVNAAYANGVINGVSDTQFGINMKVSRQDMAVMIARATGLTSEQRKTFGDSEMIAGYAADAVGIMGALGIISGNEAGKFMPDENTKRSEAAKMIYETLKYLQ